MPIRTVKPTSPARRYLTYVTYDEITKKEPEKSLLSPKTRTNGRNNMGRITVRHRGRGHKRMLRTVDFRREKFGIPARVAAIEYDPNRSANLALLFYKDGEKRYIIAPHQLKGGDTPMGGGEGKGKGNHPMTAWGKPTKGYKTRRGARPSDRDIITRRKK